MQEKRISVAVVVARILIVSGIGFAAAIGLFLLIGGAWQVGLLFLAAMFLFIFLMLLLERTAERGRGS
jgi:hypothetical protein